jgi:hypothetical protein
VDANSVPIVPNERTEERTSFVLGHLLRQAQFWECLR